jgi:hypothetical protein
MPGRNLPPRYRVITRDREASSARRGEQRWVGESLDVEPLPPAPAIAEQAPSWPLIVLFLVAAAAGGMGVALLGLIPDVLP